MKMTGHYLDNSATTMPSDAARETINNALEVWGNPSSVHSLGQNAAALLRECRASVAKTFGMPKFTADRLIFTSCGTESNAIAILGCAHSKKRDPLNPGTVILSAGEHSSVEKCAAQLETEGYTAVRVPTVGGVLDLDYLKEAVENAESPVIVAAFMLVNNETGALYDVKKAAQIVKAKYPDALVHCDAVQGYMKTRFTPYTLGVDTLTVSAHKIHSIRGAGALFISAEAVKRKNIVTIAPGGGQESGLRSGTENTVSIAAFAAAATDSFEHYAENRAKVEELRAYLDSSLAERCPTVRQNRPSGEFVPNICSIVVPEVRSETMLNYLSSREVYVSAGSACSVHSKKKSSALEAFGVSPDSADSTLRVALSYMNTADDIDALVDGLAAGIATLQKKR